jgi:hypothetical protein
LSAFRRRPKSLLACLAFAVLALALTACAFYKPGSFSISQPGGIGDVKIRFSLCSQVNEESCSESTNTGETQSLLGIAVPTGAGAPATITATPTAEGPAIVYTRSDQVAQELSEFSQGSEHSWPPAGTEGIGYLSAAFPEEAGVREWTVDGDFGLPPVADGGPFAGPFATSVWVGSRDVSESLSADRPVECHEGSWEPEDADEASCEFADADSLGISDLKIRTATASAAPGEQATLQFGLDFASSASSLPGFHLTTSTTLPQAAVNLASGDFSPPTPDPETGRSAFTLENVTVSAPATAQPGTYEVKLTATTGAGASVSQIGKLEVTKPQAPPVTKATLKLGKVKLNQANGTATLPIGVSGAGTLTVSGKTIVKVQRKAGGPKTIKVTIKAKGKAKAKLASTGKAKVKAKIAFQPSSGAAVSKSKSITLKKKIS